MTPIKNPDQEFILDLLRRKAWSTHAVIENNSPKHSLEVYHKKLLSAIRYIENLPNNLTFDP